MLGPIERFLTTLTDAGVRYLVVGGVAVVLHGYLRATVDLDLFIDLAPANVDRFVEIAEREGFTPRAPVPLRAFADQEMRTHWAAEKNMQVFSLWHPKVAGFEVDVFAVEPFPFEQAYLRAVPARVGESQVTVAAISDLIAMKRVAGRPKDSEDIAALVALQEAIDRRDS